MSHLPVRRLVLCLMMTLLSVYRSAETAHECRYGDLVKAELGETLRLSCTLEACYSDYSWSEVDTVTDSSTPLEEDGHFIEVNVTSVEKYGGKVYKCSCQSSEECQFFEIGVVPVVNLTISKGVARTGNRVTITCTAIGYPTNFEFTVQHNHSKVDTQPISDDSGAIIGVYHTISSARKRDGGEYTCTARTNFPEYENDPLQGNQETITLKVYDPPYISCTQSDTVVGDGQNQTAVLECGVDRAELWMGVEVNWTMADGSSSIREDHTVIYSERNVSYLILYRVAKNKIYTCNIYSLFGLEHKKPLTVTFLDSETCDDKDCSGPQPTIEPTNESTDDCCDQRKYWKIACLVILVFSAIWTILTILTLIFREYISKRGKKYLKNGKKFLKDITNFVKSNCSKN